MKFSQSRDLAKDEVLFFQETPPPLAYIDKGLVKFYILNSAGKERILFLGSEGEYLSGFLQEDEECRVYLQAKQDSRIIFFGKKEMEEALGNGKTDPRLIKSLFQQLGFLVREIRNITFNNFSGRLAGLLVYLEEEIGERYIFFSHQELADMLGVSRVTVTRVLGDFVEEGLVDTKRKKIKIHDLEGLKAKAGGGEDN